MAVSILHRVSGNGLAVVGLATLLCWLGAIAGGETAYALRVPVNPIDRAGQELGHDGPESE